jgi:hypothetical protein
MPDFDPIANLVYYKPTLVVSNVLYSAYRKARALKHPGQGISPEESAEGLDLLNAMIDGWKIEGLLMYTTRRSTWQVAINQKVYSIGPGGDFDMERPEHIHRASYLVNSTQGQDAEIPMEIILTFEEWQQVVVKNTPCSYPLAMFYQPFAPLGAVNFWPVPNAISTIALYTPQTLSEFATIDDAVEMPDGYREMMEYNLAVAVHELYPEKPMAPSVERFAQFYKARVKNNQVTPLFIQSDGGARQNSLVEQYVGGNPRAWVPYQ